MVLLLTKKHKDISIVKQQLYTAKKVNKNNYEERKHKILKS